MERQDRMGPWEWFVEKVLPGLFLFVAAAVGSASLGVWNSVNKLSANVDSHATQIARIQQEVDTLRAQTATKTEMLETLKRVEQQLEIVLLRNGIRNSTVKISPS